MKKMMDAAVMYGANDIKFEKTPTPELPEGGFILKVKAVGLCGSDIRNLTTDSKKGNYPYIYGHEIVGEIVEIDSSVKNYHKGQIVYVYPLAHCLKCENCRMGHHENCSEVEEYTENPGGFAEYIAYSAKRVERGAIYEIPKGKNLIDATIAEPLSSTYACMENINVTLGDSVVIAGAGPIGIFLAIIAKLRGAKNVIITDVTSERLETAKEFGVNHVINSSKENIIDKVMELTDGKGADKVISANPSSKSQQESVYLARKGGTVVFFGGIPKGNKPELDTNQIHYSNLWIYGNYGANSIQVQRAFDLAMSDVFPADKIITHTLPLSKINEGLELTKSGKALKVVLLPEMKKDE